ncbi:MAG: MBL fold metallo-hydrolase [Clostridia bacterium]|nr:MBL fold metallo-hydrolase [Clostridia bacterium]
MARKKKFSKGLTVFLSALLFVLGAAGGFFGYFKLTQPTDTDTYVSGDLVINFLELGNKYTGDCTYIKAGENDILIDAGSKTSSVSTIDEFLSERVSDGVLEYVIVTHAHEDHYAGFATNEDADSIFDLYECEVIIDFAQITENKSEQKMYKNYIRERGEEIDAGAEHYTAKECIEQGKNVFDLGHDIELEILDSYFYYNVASSENDHSVCAMINQGDRHFLFTGDLEKEGEEKLVELNDLPEVDLYKAGHHGSKTSSNDVLLEVIKPDIVCVCCCCGSSEYTDKNENQFPTQAFVDRIAPYTDKVYVTTICEDFDNDEFESMNGNITVTSGAGGVSVECSANETLLKDTAWFKKNRECPEEWKK